MAKTISEAKAEGREYYIAWNDGYWIGFGEGMENARSYFDYILKELDLPFDVDGMSSEDIINKMASMINKSPNRYFLLGG